MPDPPRPRGDKRERTRRALMAAALEVISEVGFADASLDAIARRAGVTRGSIYSNFAGRDDLIMAAVATQGMRLDHSFAEILPLAGQLDQFARTLVEQFPLGARDGASLVEFQLYAVSQPRLRDQLSSAYETVLREMTRTLEAQYTGGLTIEARALALGVQALAMGLVWQYMLTPKEVRREDVIAVFQALAHGASQHG